MDYKQTLNSPAIHCLLITNIIYGMFLSGNKIQFDADVRRLARTQYAACNGNELRDYKLSTELTARKLWP